MIIGNFNFLDICWSSLTASNHFSNHFYNFIFEHNLMQRIHSPTQKKKKGNILDLVLTYNGDIRSNSNVHVCIESPFNYDHYLVSFQFRNKLNATFSRNTLVIFDYKKADWEGLSNYFFDEDFTLCSEQDDVEEVWVIIKYIIRTGMKLFKLEVQLKSSQLRLWFSADLHHSYKCLKTCRCKAPALTSTLS